MEASDALGGRVYYRTIGVKRIRTISKFIDAKKIKPFHSLFSPLSGKYIGLEVLLL
jgi:hypothetical protein